MNFSIIIYFLVFILGLTVINGEITGYYDKNQTVGDFGVWMPAYDCWYFGGNPDDIRPNSMHTTDFDSRADINFVLYNDAFPYGKNISDIDENSEYSYNQLRWPKQMRPDFMFY
uniref:CSON015461 protein n=1 Tax=Culicoides sonorensis TaxID=179676 RepID=A0A336MD06_CULSO